MKIYTYILIAAVALCGCSKGGDSSPSGGVGLGSMSILMEMDATTGEVDAVENTYEISSDLIPLEDDLKLYISGEYTDPDSRESVTYEATFDNIATYNTLQDGAAPKLWSGLYRAQLSDDGDMTKESETNACFGSAEQSFVVVEDSFDGELSLSVTLQNSIIRLSCDEWFKSYFSEASLTITTSAGNSFTFDPFDESQADRVIFVAPDSELKLKGSAVKASGGQEVTFAENTIGTTVAGRMSSINVEAQGVGGLSVSVVINSDIVEIHEESIELNPIE